MKDVINHFILVAFILLPLALPFPLLFDELQRDFFRDRFARVVRGLHANPGSVALVIKIAFRISVGDALATRADERCGALHLSA